MVSIRDALATHAHHATLVIADAAANRELARLPPEATRAYAMDLIVQRMKDQFDMEQLSDCAVEYIYGYMRMYPAVGEHYTHPKTSKPAVLTEIALALALMNQIGLALLRGCTDGDGTPLDDVSLAGHVTWMFYQCIAFDDV
jgi:hypothetical protein